MKSGDLDRRITLTRRSGGVNAFNDPVDTWATVATVWASETPISDAERLRAGQTLAQRSSRFVVRYSTTTASVTPRDRISYDGATWDINGIKEIGRFVGYEITATTRAD